MTTQAKFPLLRGIRQAVVAGLCGVALALPLPVQANQVPFSKTDVSLSARGQNVRDFVADLFKAGGVNAKVSTAVKGKVQGVFRGNPQQIWTTISNAYGLVAYYDGGTVRVYSNQEVTSRSIPTQEPGQVVSQVARLGLTDGVNTARAGNGLVMATGVPEFLNRVQGMAGQLQQQQQTQVAQMSAPAVVQPVVQKTSPESTIASPLLRAPMARASVRSEVIRNAGKRNPFEVRIFYLKYRDAADKEVRGAGQRTIIPGIATIVMEQMGDGRQVGSVSSTAAHRYRDGSLLSDRNRGYDDRYRDDEGDESGFEPDLNGPRISADSSVNAIIVRDRPETMPIYEQLITNLDIEPLMIETQVTILELNMSKLKELGLDFGFSLDSLAILFGGGPTLGGGNISGGYLSGGGDMFFARIKALEQRGAMRVVSRPVLTSMNNQVGTFGLDNNQVIRLVGEREVDAIEIQSGMVMRIRPSAIEDGGEMRVRLDVEVSDKQYNGMSVDGVPSTSGPTLTTQTVVRHGESAMLAGITRTATYDSRQKTPILGDIPVLGQAFRKRRKGEDHIERLFLLTPRISNLGTAGTSAGYAENQVQPLTLEQLRGEAPVSRRR